MKILQTNNYKYQPTNFKSTFPVVHWIAETGGSYAPESRLNLVRKLQSKIVRALNKQLDKTTKEMNVAEQNLRAYIGRCDIDYRNQSQVRSFYNRAEANMEGTSPVAYMITGKDIEPFEEELAKDIGIAKKEGIKNLNTPYSPDAKSAIDLYNSQGLNYVNAPERRIKDKNSGKTYVLHTKFEIIRNKLGKVKGFKFIDARFLPEFGPESPFEKLKAYTKR